MVCLSGTGCSSLRRHCDDLSHQFPVDRVSSGNVMISSGLGCPNLILSATYRSRLVVDVQVLSGKASILSGLGCSCLNGQREYLITSRVRKSHQVKRAYYQVLVVRVLSGNVKISSRKASILSGLGCSCLNGQREYLITSRVRKSHQVKRAYYQVLVVRVLSGNVKISSRLEYESLIRSWLFVSYRATGRSHHVSSTKVSSGKASILSGLGCSCLIGQREDLITSRVRKSHQVKRAYIRSWCSCLTQREYHHVSVLVVRVLSGNVNISSRLEYESLIRRRDDPMRCRGSSLNR
ncbi:hypothetical protein J6590_017795 [Homalodisca vitripennis]|nr:hypothetical protein J6590_017795 [Homalodisca vitripennis]